MPPFAATLEAGPAQVGTINGAFILTAGLLSIPAGLLADRIGRTVPIIVGVSATAISSLLVGERFIRGLEAIDILLESLQPHNNYKVLLNIITS
jgi:sugar phosphate permease